MNGGRARWSGLVLALTVGCGGASDREPVPNPPAKAVSNDSPSTPDSQAAVQAPLNDDQAADRYLAIKAKFDANPAIVEGPKFFELKSQLEAITNGAEAAAMRANAALLLGVMTETRGSASDAVGYYEHAATLMPTDAGPFMALAVARASIGEFTEAVAAQEDAARLDPDNLENWLALGELRMRAGDQDGSVQAYLAYEKRRKGLIDGLTLHDEHGTYVVNVDGRIGCARALAAAADQGTAVALIYSLLSDPEAAVQAEVARVMGIHRLESYRPALMTTSAEAPDAEVNKAVTWALAEIARAPVTIEATARPRLADDDPRATRGEVPPADAPPIAPTAASTVAPRLGATEGAAAPKDAAPGVAASPAPQDPPAAGPRPPG